MHSISACTVVSPVWYKGKAPVVFVSPLSSQVKKKKSNFLFFNNPHFLVKIWLTSPLTRIQKKNPTSQLFTDIITTEEHFAGRHSNRLTCALRLTGVIYFTALSLLKSFNIKQEECHQLQLMLCFPSLGNAF